MNWERLLHREWAAYADLSLGPARSWGRLPECRPADQTFGRAMGASNNRDPALPLLRSQERVCWRRSPPPSVLLAVSSARADCIPRTPWSRWLVAPWSCLSGGVGNGRPDDPGVTTPDCVRSVRTMHRRWKRIFETAATRRVDLGAAELWTTPLGALRTRSALRTSTASPSLEFLRTKTARWFGRYARPAARASLIPRNHRPPP